jgi:hypothetical protein
MTNDTSDSKTRAEIDRRMAVFVKQTAELDALTAELATLRGEGPTLEDLRDTACTLNRLLKKDFEPAHWRKPFRFRPETAR